MQQLSFCTKNGLDHAKEISDINESRNAGHYFVTATNNKTYIGKDQSMNFKSKCLSDYKKISQ